MTSLPSSTTPALLQMMNWIGDPQGFLERNERQFGRTFRVRLTSSGNGMVWTAEPDLIRDLLTQDERGPYTAPGEANALLAPILGNRSMILLDGDKHQRHRKLVMPAFHGERMRAYGETILTATERALADIAERQVFVVREVMQEITMNVILKAVFGLNEGARYDRIKTIVTGMLDVLASPLASSLLFFPTLQRDWGAWSPWGRFLKQRRELDALLFAEIADRRANPDPDRSDVLNMLLDTHDESGEPLSDEELRDELMTMVFAGHETTATVLAWAVYWIHRDREVFGRLTEELATVDLDGDPMEIFRLPYLTAVCNETLRIYPVAMLTFPRAPIAPIELGGYSLEPDTMVMGCIYLLHHHPDLYPNSKTFSPDRFLDRQFAPFEFLPFGGGNRRCVGMALAQFEMKLVLASLLKTRSLELTETEVVPQRRGVTLGPKGGVKAIVTGSRTSRSGVAMAAARS